MVHLSKRLQALAELVTPDGVLCDVGCDHGFLPIYLIQNGVIPQAIAMDVAAGPLRAAQKHIAEAGLTAQIKTRQSDGLEALKQGEADTILLAGMGGALTLHILSRHIHIARDVTELILQPQSEIYEVRNFLHREGFETVAENLVLEDGKYYPMIKARYRRQDESEAKNTKEVSDIQDGEKKEQRQAPTEAELYFGALLIKAKHPHLKAYLLREQQLQKNILKQLSQQEATPKITQRRDEVAHYLKIVEDTLRKIDEATATPHAAL